MSRLPRKFVFEPQEVGGCHCINRCVRRSATWLARLEITEDALQRAVPATRASNLGWLNMTCRPYLERKRQPRPLLTCHVP